MRQMYPVKSTDWATRIVLIFDFDHFSCQKWLQTFERQVGQVKKREKKCLLCLFEQIGSIKKTSLNPKSNKQHLYPFLFEYEFLHY